jgi:hypothetical protein
MKKNICDILPQDINNIICEYMRCATPVCPNQAELNKLHCSRCEAMIDVRMEFFTPYWHELMEYPKLYYKLDRPKGCVMRAQLYVIKKLFFRKNSFEDRPSIHAPFAIPHTKIHYDQYTIKVLPFIVLWLFLIFSSCVVAEHPYVRTFRSILEICIVLLVRSRTNIKTNGQRH